MGNLEKKLAVHKNVMKLKRVPVLQPQGPPTYPEIETKPTVAL